MTLKQHLELEHWVKGLIKWVDDNKRWQNFDKWGFKFQYGLIPSKMTPYKMAGFAHCFYDPVEALFGRISRGDWTLFVVEDLAPLEFREDVALHERGEEISLGNHYFASQLEFAGVKRGRKTGKYVKWIDANYPTKFVDLTENVCSILPEELRAELEQKERENKETYTAQDMIDKYPLPTKVLELVVKYDDVNKYVREMIMGCIGPCQQAIYMASTIDEAVRAVNGIITPILRKISGKQARVVVPGRINAALELPLRVLREYFIKVTGKPLALTNDFFTLYNSAKEGKQIIGVV
ncbi:hypothetical protein HY485_01125 [Candidatus Woesearchaeota archaeon]|nr:hypothetical protein [Candidatus Woesearchaeota archaeon]